MTLRVVTPPVVPEGETVAGLITLAQAKAQLRVDFDDDDDLISAFIAAASSQVEANTQRRYLPQSLEWGLQEWSGHMVLPVASGGDAQGLQIDQVRYIDLNGDQQVLDPGIYWDREHGQTHKLSLRWYQEWPWLGDGAERVTIAFSINENSVVSPHAMAACRMLVGHYYLHREAVVGVDNRDSSTPLPLGVEALLSPERWS